MSSVTSSQMVCHRRRDMGFAAIQQNGRSRTDITNNADRVHRSPHPTGSWKYDRSPQCSERLGEVDYRPKAKTHREEQNECPAEGRPLLELDPVDVDECERKQDDETVEHVD